MVSAVATVRLTHVTRCIAAGEAEGPVYHEVAPGPWEAGVDWRAVLAEDEASEGEELFSDDSAVWSGLSESEEETQPGMLQNINAAAAAAAANDVRTMVGRHVASSPPVQPEGDSIVGTVRIGDLTVQFTVAIETTPFAAISAKLTSLPGPTDRSPRCTGGHC